MPVIPPQYCASLSESMLCSRQGHLSSPVTAAPASKSWACRQHHAGSSLLCWQHSCSCRRVTAAAPCVQQDNSIRGAAVPECCPVRLSTAEVPLSCGAVLRCSSCQPEVTVLPEPLTLCVEAGLPGLVLCDFVQGVLSAILVLAERLLGLGHVHLQGQRQHV